MIRRTVSRAQSGFTAVELLVTLFVAAAFIIAGYQLFNVVIKDGGETRAQSTAANTAYAYLRQYADSATNPCAPSTPLTNEPVSVDGLKSVTITVQIQCAQADAPSLSRVDVLISYNVPQKTLTYTSYIDKSKGASPNTDITNGLVGWWQLNGTTATSVGSANGTAYGAQPTVGQNSQQNTGYSFSGPCCRYIGVSNIGPLSKTITLSAWIYPTAYPSERANIFMSTPFNGTDGYYFSLNSDGSMQTYWYGASSPGYHSTGASTVPLNQWTLVTAVWDTAQVRLYTNGTLRTTVSTVSIGSNSTQMAIGAQSFDSTRQFVGSMDDVRIYNRALSGSEVLQLYNGGAK